jgi:hypothetical protein
MILHLTVLLGCDTNIQRGISSSFGKYAFIQDKRARQQADSQYRIAMEEAAYMYKKCTYELEPHNMTPTPQPDHVKKFVQEFIIHTRVHTPGTARLNPLPIYSYSIALQFNPLLATTSYSNPLPVSVTTHYLPTSDLTHFPF